MEIEEEDSAKLILYLRPKISEIHADIENTGDKKVKVYDFSKESYAADINFLKNANQIHTRQLIQPILIIFFQNLD